MTVNTPGPILEIRLAAFVPNNTGLKTMMILLTTVSPGPSTMPGMYYVLN